MNPDGIGDRYRYPGTRSFRDLEHDYRLYFGRELEAEQLFQGIRRFPLTVLSGKSGLGKTSLLQAAIFPRLRSMGFAVLTARLGSDHQGLSVVESLTANFATDCEAKGLDLHHGSRDNLWDYFQTCGIFRGVELLRPVLVLDQFEELFTALSRPRQREILFQLGPLINGKPPAMFAAELAARERRRTGISPAPPPAATNDAEAAHCPRPDVSIVIGIRHEFIGLLKTFGEHLQGIDRNMVILRPLTYEQARLAIEKPARQEGEPGKFAVPVFRYSEQQVEELLERLTFSDQRRASELEDLRRNAEWKAYAEIEPFQLQVVCQEIEERMLEIHRRHPGLPLYVPATALGGETGFQDILDRHYREAMGKVAEGHRSLVQRLFDRGLLEESQESGIMEARRKPLPLSLIEENFHVSGDTMKTLEDLRLVRRDIVNGIPFYELAHDSLIGPALRAREPEPYKLPAKVQRLLQLLAFSVLVFLVASAAFLILWRRAIQDREHAKKEAVGAEASARSAQMEAETARARADSAKRELAETTEFLSEAQRSLEEAQVEAERLNAEAERLKTFVTHYKQKTAATAEDRREVKLLPGPSAEPDSPASNAAYAEAERTARNAETGQAAAAAAQWEEVFVLSMNQLSICLRAIQGAGAPAVGAEVDSLRKWTARTVGAYTSMSRLRRQYGPCGPDPRGYALASLLEEVKVAGDPASWLQLARNRVLLENAVTEAVLTPDQFSQLWQPKLTWTKEQWTRESVEPGDLALLVKQRKDLYFKSLCDISSLPDSPALGEIGLPDETRRAEHQFRMEFLIGVATGEARRISNPSSSIPETTPSGNDLVRKLDDIIHQVRAGAEAETARGNVPPWRAPALTDSHLLRIDVLLSLLDSVGEDPAAWDDRLGNVVTAIAETRADISTLTSFATEALLLREVRLAIKLAFNGENGRMASVRKLLGQPGAPFLLRTSESGKPSTNEILVASDLNRYVWLAKDVNAREEAIAPPGVCTAQAEAIKQFVFLGLEGRMSVFDFDVRSGLLAPKPELERSGAETFSFNNSLGMRFVRVPHSDEHPGPAFICVWETREGDFRRFLEKNPSSVKGRPLARTSDRNFPAVEVSVSEAKEFCKWLTKIDHAAGVIPPAARYRLPLDGQEWGYVATLKIIAEDRPSTPIYSWGSEAFPWQHNIANFGGTELPTPQGQAVDPVRDIRVQAKYRDDFPGLAPVGSFPPNTLGIFDLDGNVREWTTGDRSGIVLQRGGSWRDSDQQSLRMDRPQGWGESREFVQVPRAQQGQQTHVGFRVVLDVHGG